MTSGTRPAGLSCMAIAPAIAAALAAHTAADGEADASATAVIASTPEQAARHRADVWCRQPQAIDHPAGRGHLPILTPPRPPNGAAHAVTRGRVGVIQGSGKTLRNNTVPRIHQMLCDTAHTHAADFAPLAGLSEVRSAN